MYYVHPKTGETAWEIPVYTVEESAACTTLQAAARMWRDRSRLAGIRRAVMRERKLVAEEARWKVSETALRKYDHAAFPVRVLVDVTARRPKKLPPQPQHPPDDALSGSDNDSLFDVSDHSDNESTASGARKVQRRRSRRLSNTSVKRGSSVERGSPTLSVERGSPTLPASPSAAAIAAAVAATPASPVAAAATGDAGAVGALAPAAEAAAPPVAADASSPPVVVDGAAPAVADGEAAAAAGGAAVPADAAAAAPPGDAAAGAAAPAAGAPRNVLPPKSVAVVAAFMLRIGTREARREALAALTPAEREAVRVARRAQRDTARVRRRAARARIARAALRPQYAGVVSGRTVVATSVKLTWSVPPVRFGWFKSGA